MKGNTPTNEFSELVFRVHSARKTHRLSYLAQLSLIRDHLLILHHNSKVVVVLVVVVEGLYHLNHRGNGFFDKLHKTNTSK